MDLKRKGRADSESDSELDGETVSAVRATPSPCPINTGNRTSPGLLCAVCSDTSSGKHYGILACNGCSGFFKRSVRRKLIYRCQAGDGNCNIDKAHRNQCQACRLKKCMQMGMNKDAVQNERQPRNSATIRYDMVEDRNLLEGTVAAAFYPVPPSNSISSSSSAFRSTGIANCCKSPASSASNYTAPQHSSTSSPAESSTSHLSTPSLVPFFSVGMESVMYEAAARLLYQSVKWAKSLPYFISLPFRDQITLLEESWSELFIMCAMQWSFPLGGYHLLGQSSERGGATGVATEFRALTEAYSRFKSLTVDPNEFAYLKAIVLLKPAAKGLKEPHQVESLQDQAQVMLSQYEKLHHAAQPARFGKLLLLLQNLHEIPTERVESLFFSRFIGNTPMEKILCDMYRS